MSKLLRYWLPLFVYCLIIFVLSSSSEPFPKSPISLNDKLLHIVGYSILGFLMIRSILSLNLKHSKGVLLFAAIVLSTLYGLSDEVHQSFIPGRNADLGDVMADGFGSLIGAFCYFKMLLK